jgi:hypothetical protein
VAIQPAELTTNPAESDNRGENSETWEEGGPPLTVDDFVRAFLNH